LEKEMVYYSPDHDPNTAMKAVKRPPFGPPPPELKAIFENVIKAVEAGKIPPGVIIGPIPIPEKPPKVHVDAGGMKGKKVVVDKDHECFNKDCATCEDNGKCPMQDCLENSAVAVHCAKCDALFTLLDDAALQIREKWNCLLEGSVVIVYVRSCLECSDSAPIIDVTEIRKE
jgi:hypothetical protein